MPVYNDTPLPTDPINQTQEPIRTNFTSIRELLVVNHADFDDPVNFGKHNVVTFPVQAVTPTFTATEFGIWNELDPITNTNQIWLNNPTIGAEIAWAQSNYVSVGATSPGSNRDGWMNLPSGFLLKFGRVVVPGGAAGATVTAQVNFPTVDAGGQPIPAFLDRVSFVTGQIGTAQSQTQLMQVVSNDLVSFTYVVNFPVATGNFSIHFIALGY